jgi:hypothetical protein
VTDSVVHPDSLNPDTDTDPDPAFQVNLDPDMQPDPDPTQIQDFDNKKMKKKIFFNLFFIKNCNLLIPRPP